MIESWQGKYKWIRFSYKWIKVIESATVNFCELKPTSTKTVNTLSIRLEQLGSIRSSGSVCEFN